MAIKSADQITIIDVTDAYSVILTSEAYTFVGGTSGVASGNSCTTQAVAFCGNAQCQTVSVDQSKVQCPTGISASVTDNNTSSVTITFTTTSTISTDCEAVIPVSVDGITVNKKFSFAVAKTGATGQTGAAGKGISSTVIEYQKSTSGTAVPNGTWSTTIPSVAASEYLWTRTTINYTTGSPSVSYSVGMMGATGGKGDKGDTGAAGKGIVSTTITYQKSSSGTTVPTGTWSSTIPNVGASEYLWTKTVIAYTSGDPSTSYSVGMMGATGAKGDKGDTGAAGADAITMTITSSNGTVFKNSSGSTVLTAHVFVGGAEQSITADGVCGSYGSIKWYKGTTPIRTSNTLTVNAKDVTSSQAYTAQLEK